MIVELRGEAEEPLLGKEGSYYIPTQLNSNFNGKPYWIQKNGNNAIWYWAGCWVIGKEVNLGTHRAEIRSASDGVANPYQVTSWKYRYFSHQDWIESNSIIVWPKKSGVPRAIRPSYVLNREDKTIEKVVPKPTPKKGDNCGLSPFHLQKINNILSPFHHRTMCSDNPLPRKTGIKGDCPLLPPEIHPNREKKIIESAVPFPTPEKGDNWGISPFHPKKIIDKRRLSPFQSKIFTVIVPLILPLFITAIYFFCLYKYRVFE